MPQTDVARSTLNTRNYRERERAAEAAERRRESRPAYTSDPDVALYREAKMARTTREAEVLAAAKVIYDRASADLARRRMQR